MTEPFFEDGLVASKIKQIIEGSDPNDMLPRDVLFVSSAGNDARNHDQAATVAWQRR